jgi:hypothetical protein
VKAEHLQEDQIQQQDRHAGDHARSPETAYRRWSTACDEFWNPAGDRRSWTATFTGQGLAVAERAAPRYARSVREHFLTQLTPAMRTELTAIGETLLGHLDPTKLPHTPTTDTDTATDDAQADGTR